MPNAFTVYRVPRPDADFDEDAFEDENLRPYSDGDGYSNSIARGKEAVGHIRRVRQLK